MGSDRQSVPVSLPSELVERLDTLVEDGVFDSRSEALRYGARLVVREERLERTHDVTRDRVVRAHQEIVDCGVSVVPLDSDALDAAGTPRSQYDSLNVFDGVHLGTAHTLGEPIVSTDSDYCESLPLASPTAVLRVAEHPSFDTFHGK